MLSCCFSTLSAKDPILRGQGPGACLTYLQFCVRQYCGPTLSSNQEQQMCNGLWKKVTGTAAQDEPPTMPSAFKERLITASIRGSPRMGLKLWWSSEGVAYRVLACKPGNRCGISATVEKFDAGEAAKCDHCNAQKHRLVCPCPSCQAQRAAAAVPAGPTTT